MEFQSLSCDNIVSWEVPLRVWTTVPLLQLSDRKGTPSKVQPGTTQHSEVPNTLYTQQTSLTIAPESLQHEL